MVSHRKQCSRNVSNVQSKSVSWSVKIVMLSLSLVAVLLFAFEYIVKPQVQQPPPTGKQSSIHALRKNKNLVSLQDIISMNGRQLAEVDIAILNLLSAKGLPDTESLDIPNTLKQLDRWAKHVRAETDRNILQYYKNPGKFNNSEAYFRMAMLITVLQQDFGVHYNERRIHEIDFKKSDDLFIHGLIGSSNSGTCVSMPVLYSAVAQRLQYPVYLVLAKGHLFCRWDGQGERVNIEGSSRGMNSYDDKHYLNWPNPIDQSEVDQGFYLKSLTRAESFSVFLATRGHCFEDNGNRLEASLNYTLALKYFPNHPMIRGFVNHIQRRRVIEDFPELVMHQELVKRQIEIQFNQLGQFVPSPKRLEPSF